MNIRLSVAIVKGLGDIEKKTIEISEENNIKLIMEKIQKQIDKIIDMFKELEKEGKIKSIYKPRNTSIQKELDELIRWKRDMKKSIKKIKRLFR